MNNEQQSTIIIIITSIIITIIIIIININSYDNTIDLELSTRAMSLFVLALSLYKQQNNTMKIFVF